MSRRIGRRAVRLLGWLLTPVMVWAASFFGGWLGVRIAPDDGKGLISLVVGAILGGVLGLVGWVGVMDRIGKRETRNERRETRD